ncbi:hypothetical protein ES708_27679 [subsurface metagenome]
MDITGDKDNPGRLDRFLSLGYSGIAGIKADEFGWKGLGSKLAFRSKLVEVVTTSKEQKTRYRIIIDAPWECIEDNRMPNPSYSESKEDLSRSGTKIQVFGYPLYKLADSRDISFESVRDFLQHRTFVGFTRERENPPKIILRGVGADNEQREENLAVGFPVLQKINQINPSFNQAGYAIADDGQTVFINKRITKNLNGENYGITIYLKGLYTTPDCKTQYGLRSSLAQGLILSVNGIPYCSLDISKFTSGRIMRDPGPSNMCFICECDEIGADMNIGRNGYTASELTQLFEQQLTKMLEDINKSDEYSKFAYRWREIDQQESAEIISETIEDLNKGKYGWVYLKEDNKKPLHRIPQTEQDVLAILWKLEGLGKLRSIFTEFRSLSATRGRGTDLIVDFRETPQNPKNLMPVEIKKIFNPKTLGHSPKQTTVIICWNIKNRFQLNKDPKISYKYTTDIKGDPINIYVIKEMKEIIEIKELDPLSDIPEIKI